MEEPVAADETPGSDPEGTEEPAVVEPAVADETPGSDPDVTDEPAAEEPAAEEAESE